MKWAGQTTESQNSWKQSDEDILWCKEAEQWKLSASKDQLINWSMQENESESFLKSLMRTPIIPSLFPPLPPKPDSPPEVFIEFCFFIYTFIRVYYILHAIIHIIMKSY